MDAPLGHDASSRFQKIDKAVLLAQCPLFSGLSSWELRSISQLMRLVEYKKDELVYKEGGEADSFYVIVSGRFEAFVSTSEKKKVLAYLRRGDYFGEMSLLTGQPHSATLRALSDSLVLEIRKDGFKKSIEHNATVSLELSRRLSSRLKVSESRSRSLFRSDVVAVYGPMPKSQRGVYSYNLAASLVAETHQKTVLVDMARSNDEPPVVGQRMERIPAHSLVNVETFSEQEMLGRLTRHRAGFDVLCLRCDGSESESEAVLISLLNHLAIDFRFIIVDLDSEFDTIAAKAVSQADAAFLVTDSHMNSLTETREIALDIERTLSLPAEKIAIVIQEVTFGAHTHATLRQELFGKKRCFTLPPTPEAPPEPSVPAVQSAPDSEYSRAMRHMARYLGGNLVGLALGSGAALGLAHIGVLKVLERERIPIDIISGSSIGALIGSLYAVGSSATDIEKAAMEIDLRLLASRLVDINLFPVRGLIHGQQVIKHFKKHLGNKSFDQCKIPLRVTGADLTTRESIIYESGLVADAVRASIAIPAIVRPVIREDRHVIVDGGILNPLPVRALHDAGANKVIAVNVFPTTKDMVERRLIQEEANEKERSQARQSGFLAQGAFWAKRAFARSVSPNLFDILMNTIQAMESEIAAVEGESADILLRPVLPSANWVDFFKPTPFIRRGEEEAEKMLPKIRALVAQQNV